MDVSFPLPLISGVVKSFFFLNKKVHRAAHFSETPPSHFSSFLRLQIARIGNGNCSKRIVDPARTAWCLLRTSYYVVSQLYACCLLLVQWSPLLVVGEERTTISLNLSMAYVGALKIQSKWNVAPFLLHKQ